MWDLSIQLVATGGVGWEFTYTLADVFFVFLNSGCFAFCGVYVSHYISLNKKQFTIFFANASINFPLSELERFEHFLQRARAARPVL